MTNKEKKQKLKILIPPEGFNDYEWDEKFKVVMFALEFTRNEMSGKPNKYAKKLAEEWGYKDTTEVYNLLWGNFKYYKGTAFNEQFSIVEGCYTCNACGENNNVSEVKPGKPIYEQT